MILTPFCMETITFNLVKYLNDLTPLCMETITFKFVKYLNDPHAFMYGNHNI